MHIIGTTSGEDVVVAAHGEDHVTVSVRCPDFGGISRVRLSRDETAALAGSLTAVVLDLGAGSPGVAGTDA